MFVSTPIKQRPYPINLDKRKFVLDKIKEIERQEIIEPSDGRFEGPAEASKWFEGLQYTGSQL